MKTWFHIKENDKKIEIRISVVNIAQLVKNYIMEFIVIHNLFIIIVESIELIIYWKITM